jgi:hypothetical protein
MRILEVFLWILVVGFTLFVFWIILHFASKYKLWRLKKNYNEKDNKSKRTGLQTTAERGIKGREPSYYATADGFPRVEFGAEPVDSEPAKSRNLPLSSSERTEEEIKE